MDQSTYLSIGKSVLENEIESLSNLVKYLDYSFTKACEVIATNLTGKVVVAGIGKSGIIGHKIASTLSSTGTPAVFLNAAEGLHGDLGIIGSNDIVLLISNSGSTQEILALLPSIRQIGAQTISITSKPQSSLATSTNIHLNLGMFEEACHLKLAPTTSTLLTLALGDALAVAISQKKGFKKDDYAVFHPGGLLGRRLLLRADDIMTPISEKLWTLPETTLEDAIVKMVSSPTGGIIICDQELHLQGLITDGDIKRIITEYGNEFLSQSLQAIMTPNPITVLENTLATNALEIMQGTSKEISFLPVMREDKVVGILKLHDILKLGLGKESL